MNIPSIDNSTNCVAPSGEVWLQPFGSQWRQRESPQVQRIDGQNGADGTQNHYQTLLQNLPWAGAHAVKSIRTLGFTSCYRGEGTTTVAAHVAATAATYGQHRVLLVDANVQSPAVQRAFNVRYRPGLIDALMDRDQVDAAFQPTYWDNLFVMTLGSYEPEIAHVCDSRDRFADLLEAIHRKFHFVVFDLPCTTASSAVPPLVRMLDGVVLVLESDRVHWEVAQRTQTLLTRAGARLLGVVMNKRVDHVPNWIHRPL